MPAARHARTISSGLTLIFYLPVFALPRPARAPGTLPRPGDYFIAPTKIFSNWLWGMLPSRQMKRP
jgi:hypothetical protein